MSGKGVIRAIKASILVTAVLWTTIMATGGEGEQAQAIVPGGSEAEQKHVMSVEEMCVLLDTSWFFWRIRSDRTPVIKTITTIRISLDEISAKEKDFENKAAPTKETMGGQEIKTVYSDIRITDKITQDSIRVIESKHILALIRFLQMFAGCRVGKLELFIYPQNVSQNKEELKRIRETICANIWVGVPINVKLLRLCSEDKAKNTHPVLLQVLIHAVRNTEAVGEEAMRIYITIAVKHIQQILQQLGSLKCKKVKEIRIEIINNKEQAAAEELSADKAAAAEETKPAEVVQEWRYEVEELQVSVYYSNVSAILPVWLVGKPTQELRLEMCQYTCLSKEEVQSIRARKLWVYMNDKIDLHSIESYAAQKKSEGVPNAKVSQLDIWHLKDFTEKDLTKEEALKHIRSILAWAATQFSCLSEIYISSLYYLFGNNYDLYQAISRMSVVFRPRMQNLKKVVIDKKEVYVVGSEYALLRKMPVVFHPKLWQAFTSGKMEAQINGQLGLKEEDKKEHIIRLQASESDKGTEQFSCFICSNEFREYDDSSWIYVTGTCRHAFCLSCMNENHKTCRATREGSSISESTTKCMMHNTLLLDWRTCMHIEEAENNTYTVTLSNVEEDKDGNVHIKDGLAEEKEVLVVEYQGSQSSAVARVSEPTVSTHPMQEPALSTGMASPSVTEQQQPGSSRDTEQSTGTDTPPPAKRPRWQ